MISKCQCGFSRLELAVLLQQGAAALKVRNLHRGNNARGRGDKNKMPCFWNVADVVLSWFDFRPGPFNWFHVLSGSL